MSEMMEHGIWYRLRYTPLRDAMRGRMSARLDSARKLGESGLPAPVQDLIRLVSRDARLWRLERAEVIEDLVAHFQDGIVSGQSAEQLLESFGDASIAAQLIRRAMRRNRPIAWRAVRFVSWSGLALLMGYFCFALYFFSGAPTPRVDYVALINDRIEQAPVGDRAWPLYREALLGLGEIVSSPVSRAVRANPGDSAWQSLVDTVREHPPELETIRLAAARPNLGFLYGVNGSAYDSELWPTLRAPEIPEGGQKLSGVLLPHLQPMLNLAALLRVDAVLAREEGDRTRLIRDIDAILGISGQLGEDGTMLSGLFSLVGYDVALHQLQLTLEDAPDMLSDKEWTAFAHRLSGPETAADLISLDFERLSFEDFIQRVYTDDGGNHGRLTSAAADFTRLPRSDDSWFLTLLEPAAGLVVASRQDLSREYETMMARVLANWAAPLRDTDWSGLSESYRRFDSWRYFPLVIFSPRYETGQANFERHLGERDGVVVRIAVELYKRRQRRYPAELNELVPSLLPRVPADRITGAPVRYTLAQGKPVIYSVGADRDDDGGRGTINAAQWEPLEGRAPDGDWVLDGQP